MAVRFGRDRRRGVASWTETPIEKADVIPFTRVFLTVVH